MRILIYSLLRLIYSYKCEHLYSTLFCFLLCTICMKKHCFLKLVAYRKYRIKRCHRILEND